MAQDESNIEDEYSKFLETWKPSPILLWATNSLNLNDEYGFQRLLASGRVPEKVERAPFIVGTKEMTDDEKSYRKLEFFKETQAEWSTFFRESLLNEIEEEKVDLFLKAFAETWIDGSALRHSTSVMMSIKASIQNHDVHFYGEEVKNFVIQHIPSNINPLFNELEMAKIFEVNNRILEVYLGKYLCESLDQVYSSISNLIVRRGIYMSTPPEMYRRELHYLSSYSMCLTPVEQFAVTYTSDTQDRGYASIFGVPFPAIQNRVVAFAPLIPNMNIDQLEIVLPPPVKKTQLHYEGLHGDIAEYVFDPFPYPFK